MSNKIEKDYEDGLTVDGENLVEQLHVQRARCRRTAKLLDELYIKLWTFFDREPKEEEMLDKDGIDTLLSRDDIGILTKHKQFNRRIEANNYQLVRINHMMDEIIGKE